MELNYQEEALILLIRAKGWTIAEVLSIIEDAHTPAQTVAREVEVDSKVGWPLRWSGGDGQGQRWTT
jgi:hypothetical protein